MIMDLIWKDAKGYYTFKSNMTKTEWKELTHFLRTNAFNELVHEDKPWYEKPAVLLCSSIMSNLPKLEIATQKSYRGTYVRSCRKLYMLYKKSGDMEEAQQALEDARKWMGEH